MRIRAECELNYEVLRYAFDEIFKSPSRWSNATSTEIKYQQKCSSLWNLALMMYNRILQVMSFCIKVRGVL